MLTVKSHLSLRQTPSGPASAVRLIESQRNMTPGIFRLQYNSVVTSEFFFEWDKMITDLILTCTVLYVICRQGKSCHLRDKSCQRLVLKRVTYISGNLRIFSLNRNLRSHSAPHKCLLTISKCPLSVLWRCPSYREFGYSKMTEKWPGPAPDVPLIEVSVKRELTVVYCKWMNVK